MTLSSRLASFSGTFSRRRIIFALAAFSAAALAFALVSQYGFGLYPCELCLYQRVPYIAAVVLGVLAPFIRRDRAVLALMGVLFAAGAAIAAFHVGVEQKWWPGTDACALDLASDDLDAIRRQIMNAPRALCGDIAWSFLGISMAGYNVLLSGALTLAALAGFRKK